MISPVGAQEATPNPEAIPAPLAEPTTPTTAPADWPAAEILLDVPTQPIALREATVRALELNTELAVARLSPPISKERILSAKGAFDAIVTGSASFSRDRTQAFLEDSNIAPGEEPTRASRRTAARLGVTKRWFTGTETTLEGSIDRSASSVTHPEYSSSLVFTVRQSLLRGLRPAANLAQIRQAENAYKRSLYGLRSDAINTVASVENAYWNLALAYELLGVQQFSHELAKRQLERTQAFVDVGKLSELDLVASQAEVASRERDYIDAKNNLEQRAIDFLLLTEASFDDAGEFVLPRPADEAALPPLPGSDAESLKLALATRPDLFQAHLDLENGKLDVIRTADGLLPQLDLTGSYGLTGRGLSDGQSLHVTGRGDYDQYSVGVELQAPLPNRRARGDWRAAKLTREQLDRSIENLRQRIRADVLKARVDLENRVAAVGAARVSLELQQRKLVNEEEKWRNDLSTNLDVIQAQRDLVNARNQLVINIAEALKSETNLYVQEGSLLEVRGFAAEGGEELK